VVSPAAERRVVTVLFADLASSTELAARLDPERLREVLVAFHQMVSEEIEWLGGRAERFIGDAVLGVFGTPVARDDDAVRAVRAALGVVDGAQRLGRRLVAALPMQVRVGVNTGRVAVGTAADRSIVIGAEVNAAARLQQAAEPGEILVGTTTHELAQGAVEFGDRRTVEAKGFDRALEAWPVRGLTEHLHGRNVPFIDRRRELRLLADAFDRARAHERAHLVTLLGEPGIGKSRVLEEFLARLPEDVTVLAGRSSAFEEEVTFWPLAQMVYGQIGELRGTDREEVLERLHEAARDWVDTGEVDRAALRLGLALGLGDEGTEENRYHSAEVRQGMLTMLTGLAAHGPVLLVFEDMRDADPLLLDLIEQLVREARRLPLMVVCVARWEFLEDRPGWAGGIADAVTLWVEPLTFEESVELAMAAGELDREESERVARHAGGNPFFIVEITAMLRREATDALEARDGAPRPRGSSPVPLPPTVQAVIAARLDTLSPAARELVRRASVFPRGRFDAAELGLVTEPDEALLHEAEEHELLEPDPDRPGVWRFRSDVLREVAYEGLAKRERQRLHLRAADRLSAPETVELYPRTIAYHLEQAARAALDLDPSDRALADRAVDALSVAGDQARRRMELRAAADLYQRALALAGLEETWTEREAWCLSALGECRYWLGEFDLADDALGRALAIGGSTSDRVRAHASRFLADLALTAHGDDERAAVLFEDSLEAARRQGEPYALARSLLMAGWAPFWRNDLDLAERRFLEALGVTRSSSRDDAWAESRSLVGLANVTSARGDEQEALALAMEALRLGRDSGQSFTSAVAAENVAASQRRMMLLDDALAHADEAVTALRELGARWELAAALGDRGSIHRVAGRLEEAERDLREAFVLCRDLSERALVTWTAAELARTLAARADTAAARGALDDPVARIAEGEPGSASALLVAESVIGLVERDLPTARAKAEAAVGVERGPRGTPNTLAATIWWAGSLFGPASAGGEAEVERARERLERNGWRQALVEPDLVRDLVGT
jgi:class 3 adenylate cyclase/tetratricopeptide (TPR) repeat protein